MFTEPGLAGARNAQSARFSCATDPAERKGPIEKCRAKTAGKVWPSLAPIKASAAKRAV